MQESYLDLYLNLILEIKTNQTQRKVFFACPYCRSAFCAFWYYVLAFLSIKINCTHHVIVFILL